MTDMIQSVPQPPTDGSDKLYNERRDRIVEFLTKKGLFPLKCACCKTSSQMFFLGHKDMLTVTPLSKNGMYYPSYALACSNCGFIHSFHASVVENG
ncbi:hypothetical protein [Gluconobacter albidus]|uniref:hypothetical protein n=1 Tax=Gluconobacter albidus TaxID=318683 RepID=UPI0020A06648|nr:hypothetical protein [Gluconobacter albidus]MCP1273211.1 hypothetical protein [Gluconobacter albidus]